MHVSFIPYGKRECVEKFLRELEAQKHELRMYKGDEEKSIFIDAQVRVCPFGIYEYVFPKEDIDIVLNTLGFSEKAPYRLGAKATILRKLFGYKKAPNFNKEKTYMWIKEHVSIIPIGIKEDSEIVGELELDKGWTHEAI